MAFFGIHLTLYLAVSGFCTAVWLFAGGSMAELEAISWDPLRAVELGFWPIWVWLSWGTGIVVHAGILVSVGLFGRRARRRRAKMAKAAAQAGTALARETSRVARGVVAKRQPPRSTGPERRWVTVLFSDIVDSTRHAERLGDDAWIRILGRYRELVRDAVRDRDGSEVGTQGDGILARFPSPAEAVLCAVEIQRVVGEQRSADPEFPEVRIGVHAGEAVEEDGDLVGRVVNLASRVTDEAEPGEILVTEPVADQLVGHLALEDRGLRPLKGLSQPRHLLAVVWEAGEE